jgi:hypothetical protein
MHLRSAALLLFLPDFVLTQWQALDATTQLLIPYETMTYVGTPGGRGRPRSRS